MAKKNRNDFGSMNLDSELDFDFDFDQPPRANKNKSKPVDQVIEGVKASMKSKFTDPSTLKTLIRKAMPEGFSQAWDTVDTVIDSSQELYDQATKELRPHLGSISRKIDALTPDEMTKTKRFTQMLKDKLSPELPSKYEHLRANAEDTGVERMLAEMELSRAQVDGSRRAADRNQELVKERIAGKRFEGQQRLLGVIANESIATRSYLTGYNVVYQKKSLELQYRTYAAMAGMSSAFAQYVKRTSSFQDSLLLNTSLPEYAKTSNTQRWKQISKEQVFGNLNKGIFGDNNRIAAAGQRLIKKGKELISDKKDQLEMINDALESVLDMKELDKDMAEFEGRSSSGYRMAGQFGGEIAGDMIVEKIADKIKELASKHKGFMKASYTAGRYTSNMGTGFDALRNSDWFKKMGNSGEGLGSLFKDVTNSLISALRESGPDLSIKSVTPGSEGEDKLHTETRKARSINEIIPGYLSRILREITVLRTGDNKTGLLVFDSKTDRFKTEANMSADLRKSFTKAAAESRVGKRTYAEQVKKLNESFIGNEEVSDADRKNIEKFLTRLSRSKDDFDITESRIKTTKEFKDLSADQQSIVSSILNKRFNDVEAAGDDAASLRKFKLAQGLSKTKGAMGSIMAEIQAAIKEGHGPLLERQGVIKRTPEGNWNVDEEAYYRFYDETIGTSDINVKTNIRPTGSKHKPVPPSHQLGFNNKNQGLLGYDGARAVNGIKNTKVYDWEYKSDQGYEPGTATGPMAQDVRKNFGEKAAPNGRSIDLVNMNGQMMSAVKKLAEMVESMGAGESLRYMREIAANTLSTSELLASGKLGGSGVGTGEGGNFPNTLWGHLSKTIGEGAGYAFGRSTDAAKSMYSMGKGAATFAKKAAEQLWSENKDDVKKARDSVIEASISGFTKAVKFGSEVINVKIPSAMGFLGKIGRSALDFIKSTLNKAQDLYVQGRESPAIEGMLLQAGMYRDQLTGKVLTTMDDLVAAKGNIINSLGQVVLTAEDKARGVFTSTGERLRSFKSIATSVVAGVAVNGYNKIKDIIKNHAALGTNVKDKFSNISSYLGDKLGDIKGFNGFGVGGTDKRVVPILFQIRDLLAIGKRGPRVKEILSRVIEASVEEKKFTKETIKDALSSGGDKQEGLLDKLRDLFSFGKKGDTGQADSTDKAVGASPTQNPSGVIGGIRDIFSHGKNAAGKLKDLYNARQASGSWKEFAKEKLGRVINRGKRSGTLADARNNTMMLPGVAGMMQLLPPSTDDSSRELAMKGSGIAQLPGQGGFAAGNQVLLEGPSRKRGKRRWEDDRVTDVQAKRGMFGRMKDSLISKAQRGRAGLGSALEGAKGMIGKSAGVLGGLFGLGSGKAGSSLTESAGSTYSAADHANRLLQLGSNKSGARGSSTALFSDRDGDGERDNGVSDRYADAAAHRLANEERKNAGIRSSQEAAAAKAGRNSPADDAIEKMIKVATAGLSAIAGSAGSILSGAADLAGGVGDLLRKGKKKLPGGLGRTAKVAGGLGRGIGGAYRGVKALGTGIKSVIGMVPGASTAAKVGMGAMRAAQVVGLAGAGSGAMVTGAIGLLGSALASPVVIGAGAIAAAGYGGYLAYKYMSRNKIDEYQKIRYLQYGLDATDATSSYNHKVTALEKYLLDGNLQYSNGRAYLNDRSINNAQLLELFDIKAEDEDQVGRFADWIRDRFKPVFLHHVNILYKVDNKAKLLEVGNLDNNKMLEYLSKAQVDEVWQYTTSPFKGLDVLNNNPAPARALIDAKIKEVGLKINKKSKEEVKDGSLAPKGAAAAASHTAIKSAIPATADPYKLGSPSGENTTHTSAHRPTPVGWGSVPANSSLAKSIQEGSTHVRNNTRVNSNLVSEDGSGVKDDKSTNTGTTLSTGVGINAGNLKLATGPISDGSAGMQFVKLGSGATLVGMQPRLLKHFLGMAQEYGETTGKQILVNQAARSYQEQERLWRKDPTKAARPGTSLHEKGLALDINTGIVNELERLGLMRKYGFTRPVGGETWHIEPAGIQQSIQKAKEDPAYADAGIAASLGKGGGGYGSIPRNPVGGRNTALAKIIYDSTVATDVNLATVTDKSTSSAGGGRGFINPSMPTVNSSVMTAATSKQLDQQVTASNPTSPAVGAAVGRTDAIARTKSDIAKYAQEAQGDPNKMLILAAMESDFRQNAKASTSSAAGPMQIVNGTWNEQMNKHGDKYGITGEGKNDVRASTLLATEYMKSNDKIIAKAKGGKPDIVDSYMGHFLGAHGASILIRARPDDIAATKLPNAASSNRPIFYDGVRPRTVSEVRELLKDRILTKAKKYGISVGDLEGSFSGTDSSTDRDTSVSSSTRAPIPGTRAAAMASIPSTSGQAYGTGVTSSTPMFSQRDESAISTNAGFDVPEPRSSRIPSAMGLMGQRRDTATNVTNELFDRLQTTGDTQIKHLSSIDTTLTSMVPILKQIADNTGATAVSAEVKAGNTPSASTSVNPRVTTSTRSARADTSSFDNRRSLQS